MISWWRTLYIPTFLKFGNHPERFYLHCWHIIHISSSIHWCLCLISCGKTCVLETSLSVLTSVVARNYRLDKPEYFRNARYLIRKLEYTYMMRTVDFIRSHWYYFINRHPDPVISKATDWRLMICSRLSLWPPQPRSSGFECRCGSFSSSSGFGIFNTDLWFPNLCQQYPPSL